MKTFGIIFISGVVVASFWLWLFHCFATMHTSIEPFVVNRICLSGIIYDELPLGDVVAEKDPMTGLTKTCGKRYYPYSPEDIQNVRDSFHL